MNRDPYSDYDNGPPGAGRRGSAGTGRAGAGGQRSPDQGWRANQQGSTQRRRSASPDYERGGTGWRGDQPIQEDDSNYAASFSAQSDRRGRGRRGGRGRDRAGPPPGAGGGRDPPPRWKDQDDYRSPPRDNPYSAPSQQSYNNNPSYDSRGPPPPPSNRYDDYGPPPPRGGRGEPPINLGIVVGGKDRDETSLIEDRVRAERPCRTLFVRNIKYETPSDLVRERFDRLGEVRTFFDLISTRGMVFITYFDLRAAMLAKDSLQGGELAGRPIDVHFSLPRDSDLSRPCTRDKGQGTILVFIREPRRELSDHECKTRFTPFGDIKSITPHPTRGRERLVEYFDSRAAERAFDELNGKPLAGGMMELELVWDTLPPAIPGGGPPPPLSSGPPYNNNNGGNYGPPPPSHAYGGGGGDRDQRDGYRGGDRDSRDFRDGLPPPLSLSRDGPPPRDRDGGREWDRDRERDRFGPPFSRDGPPTTNHYSGPPSNGPPAGGPPGSVNDRLAQAQKVQQLLSALATGGGGGGGSQPPSPSTNGPPPSQGGPRYDYPPLSQNQGPPYSQPPPTQGPPYSQNQYSQPPPQQSYNSQPAYNSNSQPPPHQQQPQQSYNSPTPAQAALPPALLALLGNNNSSSIPPPPPPPQQTTDPRASRDPRLAAAAAGAGTGYDQGQPQGGQGAPAQVQALLALLAQQHGR